MRRDLESLFAALDSLGVRTVVVGGLAVNLRGHLRMTIDVDLVVDLAGDAPRQTVEALLALGYRPSVPVDPFAFADPETREHWLEERNMRVFSWFHAEDPLSVIDLFLRPPLEFEALWKAAESLAPARGQVRVASVPDLIRMKRASGRPRDLEDAEALEAIDREPGER